MKIVECPRDAMQGFNTFVPTQDKAKYINQLLKVGFDTIDFGSFVSPKAIPQMKDTAQVLDLLDLSNTPSKLLAIVANERGATDAAKYGQIEYVGFPLSISETFQQRNTNKSISEAFDVVYNIQNLCLSKNKKLVVYISMAFGNPYGDPFDDEVVNMFVEKLVNAEVACISLADTIGVATPALIKKLYSHVCNHFEGTEFGLHLHASPNTALEKIEAAHMAGCKRIDGAINGYGGCPMAKDELVGNIPTELLVNYLEGQKVQTNIDIQALEESMRITQRIFQS